MDFQDPPPGAPWWVAWGLGGLAVLAGALHLYDRWRTKRNEWAASTHKTESTVREDLTEEQKEARRDSAAEAWEVVDKFKLLVKEQADQIAELLKRDRVSQEREVKCRTALRILFMWSKNRKNPPPIPADLLEEFGEGSGLHTPLPVLPMSPPLPPGGTGT